MIRTILHILMAVVALMAVIYYGLLTKLFHLLRDRHPETFESLGSPNLPYTISNESSRLLLRFLYRGDFNSLHDPQVTKLCQLIVGHFVISMFIALAGFIVMLIYQADVIRAATPH